MENTNKYEGTDKDFIIASLIKIFTEENVEELKKENDLKEQINNNETFICATCNLVFEDKQLYNKHVKNICQNHTTNITNNTLNQQNNVINIALSLPLALAGLAETFIGLKAVFFTLAVIVLCGGLFTWYNAGASEDAKSSTTASKS